MTPGAWIVLGVLALVLAGAALLNAISIATGTSPLGEAPLSSGDSALAPFLESLIGGTLLVIAGVFCIMRGRRRLADAKTASSSR